MTFKHFTSLAVFVACIAWTSSLMAAGTEPLKIETAKGSYTFQVEIADNDKTRAKGLMHRRQMANAHGMLFDFRKSAEVSFWMRNTHISLDMIFIRADGVVHTIATDTVPLSEKLVPSRGAVRFVLELNAGMSRSIGLKPGDRVVHRRMSSQ